MCEYVFTHINIQICECVFIYIHIYTHRTASVRPALESEDSDLNIKSRGMYMASLLYILMYICIYLRVYIYMNMYVHKYIYTYSREHEFKRVSKSSRSIRHCGRFLHLWGPTGEYSGTDDLNACINMKGFTSVAEEAVILMDRIYVYIYVCL
jgi:hypothetical protein